MYKLENDKRNMLSHKNDMFICEILPITQTDFYQRTTYHICKSLRAEMCANAYAYAAVRSSQAHKSLQAICICIYGIVLNANENVVRVCGCMRGESSRINATMLCANAFQPPPHHTFHHRQRRRRRRLQSPQHTCTESRRCRCGLNK